MVRRNASVKFETQEIFLTPTRRRPVRGQGGRRVHAATGRAATEHRPGDQARPGFDWGLVFGVQRDHAAASIDALVGADGAQGCIQLADSLGTFDGIDRAPECTGDVVKFVLPE